MNEPMSFAIDGSGKKKIPDNPDHPIWEVFMFLLKWALLVFVSLFILAKVQVYIEHLFNDHWIVVGIFDKVSYLLDTAYTTLKDTDYREQLRMGDTIMVIYYISYIFLLWEWNRRAFRKLTIVGWLMNIIGMLFVLVIPYIAYAFIAFAIFKSGKILLTKLSLLSGLKVDIPVATNDESKDLKIRIPTDRGKLRIDNLFRNLWLLAGPGSGKTNLLRFLVKQLGQKDFALIVYDFKFPSLAIDVANAYRNSKVRPHYLSLSDVEKSCRLNPILPENMSSSAHAIEYANVIMSNLTKRSDGKDNFFDRSATMLLAATLWYLREEHPECCTIPHAVSMIQHRKFQDVTIQKMCDENLEVEGMIVSVVTALENKAGNQTAGVISTLQNAMARLNLPQIFWVLTENELSLDLNNPDEPKALVLGNDGELDAVFSPILALIYTVALKKMNKRGMHHSCSLIDEGYTIYIPEYAKYPSTSRENRLAHIFSAQDYSQVEEKWGEKEAEILAGVFSSHAYGKTTNHRSMERIQKMFGRKDELYINRSHGSTSPNFLSKSGGSNSSNIGESIQERDRIKIQDIKDMKSGELIGFLAEGNTVEFRCRVKEFKEEQPIQELPSREVTHQMMKDNFKRVRADIDAIISGDNGTGMIVQKNHKGLELEDDRIKGNGEVDGRGLEV